MTLVSLWEGTEPRLATVTGFPGVRLRIAFLKAHADASHVLELLEYVSHPRRRSPRALIVLEVLTCASA